MTKTVEQYESEWKAKVGESNENIYDLIDPLMTPATRPDNAVTLAELCKKYHVGKNKVNKMLSKLMSEGKVVRQRVESHIYYVMVKK